jgi:hypothetical protein
LWNGIRAIAMAADQINTGMSGQNTMMQIIKIVEIRSSSC